MNKLMTIYEIARRTYNSAPYYFSRKTLKFFGQTMRDFSVTHRDDGKYYICAPMRKDGKIIGKSERIFNPFNNTLERI